jgi:hypothetical protein
MAALLRQGIAAGEIPDQNVELSAAALVGAICELRPSGFDPAIVLPVCGQRLQAVDDIGKIELMRHRDPYALQCAAVTKRSASAPRPSTVKNV